ncbi:dipeptide ABC transporter ATP-binding protein [Sinorhizobium meliloti]|uniref:ABC transporter ATP-binding protein n=1 Tax=Rhizobium meliloti TaxID=382 RepID=UPI000FD1D565|nr:ABC transporter ATP-binding protein [Sinorhizobium meliloti]MDW9415002.1 dipeptide ABC transporter ATP-binding protein [Sinorhizobium meliloti]MDW9479874.1 dipeptide ABC transporter ATP-binding protein [Sinorhizobium meliloti]MDW9510137.1 dipeptide ABC transporter ATP-binding protein [Sinorhizobium meliloti]MDW9634713.1 ABC transporter ATP-binding protein [Sinorhizobium meliloti]MDW9667949.1 dipeptide ABC transporter ATP-binding protein [Sinorhizobium meliloti]
MTSSLLSVKELTVQVATPTGPKVVVERLSFDLLPGRTLCLAGESGSGKSMTALSLMQLLPKPMARIAGGSANLDGEDILALPEARMRRIRGRKIGMIFQEPMTSLNPVMTVGNQLIGAITAHGNTSGRRAARARAVELLDQVQIPEPERRLGQYPHELSGGLRQRIVIAMALAQNPKILIADEPTTALDVTVQAQILALIRKLQADHGISVIMITHDMGVVAEMADEVLVMKHGRTVEHATSRDLFAHPQDAYTKELLSAVPRLGEMAGTETPKRAAGKAVEAGSEPGAEQPMLQAENLTVRFDIKGGILQRPVRRLHAVEGISFSVRRGETLSLVGESGCGKSTTGKALLNLVPWTGDIRVDGRSTRGLRGSTMRPILRDVQMIFQDPYASLDPRMRVGDLVAEPLVIHGLASGSELRERVEYLFKRVGLSPEQMKRYPHEFSGGQRQRICIARALSLSPKLIVADESVAALDVSIQAQVLDLLQDIQDETGVSYLFISHDMAVVEQISHRVAVMYMGRFVEMGTRRQIFENPQHPYTKKLMAAVPVADPGRARRDFVPKAEDLPSPVRALDYAPSYPPPSDLGGGHLVWSG